MKKPLRIHTRLLLLVLAAALLLSFAGCASAAAPQTAVQAQPTWPVLDEDGSYTTAEDVSSYLLEYGHLPDNFITKKEAKALGWSSGSLEPYAPGKCLGGDSFGNREGLLPKAEGRTWTECDINTLGKDSRGDERLVFSNDGLIYYTGDRYKSFVFLASAEPGGAALDGPPSVFSTASSIIWQFDTFRPDDGSFFRPILLCSVVSCRGLSYYVNKSSLGFDMLLPYPRSQYDRLIARLR